MEANTPPPLPGQSPAPALWNPSAAANWSLIFTPAFGAILHAKNAKTLGREAEAKTNWIWAAATLGYLLLTLALAFVPGIPDALIKVGGLGLLLGWYLSTAKGQMTYVKESWGSDYPRKGWALPMGIAAGCIIIFFIGCLIFGMIYGILFGVPEHMR